MPDLSSIFAPNADADGADIAPPPEPVLTPDGTPPPAGPDPNQPDDPQGSTTSGSDFTDDGF